MIVHSMPQYSPAWWSMRRGIPTCSEFSRIITPRKEELASETALVGYAAELLGQFVDPGYGQNDEYVSAAMAAGSMMEPKARAWYQMFSGAEVKQVGFCMTDDGRFGGSPDSLVGDDGCIEIKSPMAKTHILYLLAGELPAEHKAQVHGHLIVTGRAWCDFVSYYRGLPPLRVRVTPDAFTDKLRARLDEFHKLYTDVKSRVDYTPILFEVPEEAPRMTDDEALGNAAFGTRREQVVVGDENV